VRAHGRVVSSLGRLRDLAPGLRSGEKRGKTQNN